MSSKRAIRRRGCSGKRRYKTMEAAISAARWMFQSGSRPPNAYGCKFCKGFHTGHMPGKTQRLIEKRREG